MPHFKNTKQDNTNKPQKVADVPQFQIPILELKSTKAPNVPGPIDRQNQKISDMTKEDMTTLLRRNQFFNLKDKAREVAVMEEYDDNEDSELETKRENYLKKFQADKGIAAQMKEKLITLFEMGFDNYETNIGALIMNRGDLEKAMIMILEKKD